MILRDYQIRAVDAIASLPTCRYNYSQVLKTLSKAVPRAVKAIFLCLPSFAPMGRVRLAVTRAARLSTCFHTLSAPAENREKKSLDWSVPAMKPIDLTGQVFGRWSIVSYESAGRWLCRCKCGTEKIIACNQLRAGETKSCGCWKREKARIRMTEMRRQPHPLVRFESFYNIDQTTQCWNWNRKKDKNGYGIFFLNGGAERAHRFSYKHYRKIDPLDLMVCHRCDNPSCVNPDHLFLGTCQDNLRDALQKGRFAIGDLNGRSKLTPEQVKELLQSPESGASLAKKWGVNRSTINRIRRGEGWRNV